MIGILGGMGTQAGLDFCNKLAILNRGKIDQEYPLFILFKIASLLQKSNPACVPIPPRMPIIIFYLYYRVYYWLQKFIILTIRI